MRSSGFVRCSILTVVVLGCGENRTPASAPMGSGVLGCLPDLDGKIEARELQPAIGASAAYLISPAGQTRSIDVAGTTDEGGRRVWDLTASPDDPRVALGPQAIAERWYRASFPGATFVTPVDRDGRVEAAYSQDEGAIWLHGVASSEPAPAEGKTLLVYEHPVAVLRFPVTAERAWTETGRIAAGTVQGLPYVGEDRYEVRIDGGGRIVLPDVEITQALRVRTLVTVAPAAGNPRTRRQVQWMFECLGEVARAMSRDDEPAEDFTTAVEVRRLGF